MRISDWSSDVCSSDLWLRDRRLRIPSRSSPRLARVHAPWPLRPRRWAACASVSTARVTGWRDGRWGRSPAGRAAALQAAGRRFEPVRLHHSRVRSEEHTSELQSLIRNPYSVFCLKKKKNGTTTTEKIQRRTSTSTDINRNDSNKLQIEKHTYRITSHNLLNNTAHSNQ